MVVVVGVEQGNSGIEGFPVAVAVSSFEDSVAASAVDSLDYQENC